MATLKSESMGWSDIGVKCEAFEMVQVPSVTYKRKAIVAAGEYYGQQNIRGEARG